MQIVFTDKALGLTKDLSSWRTLQDRFAGYKASLGPYSIDEVVAYFTADYPVTGPPFSREQIEAFMTDDNELEIWTRE